MNTSHMKTVDLVDELGTLKAQQSELAKKEKAIKEAIAKRIKARKSCELDGEFFRVVRVTVHRETIDTAEVKRMLTDPPVKVSISQSFRVNSRVAEAA